MMRLIDADKLMRHLMDWALHDGAPEIRECMKAVKEQPTVYPVKHGQWIPLNDQIAKCSSCGAMESTFGKDRTGHALIHKAIKHYCPNCGSKMDEVEE